jgi:hypothetical protein
MIKHCIVFAEGQTSVCVKNTLGFAKKYCPCLVQITLKEGPILSVTGSNYF